jgi:hypothetical protein
LENTSRENHLEDLGEDGSIILKGLLDIVCETGTELARIMPQWFAFMNMENI